MSAFNMANSHAVPICMAQMVGITAPAIYSSLTFAYSAMVMPPLIAHSPPNSKLLAKQWLQAYQSASVFVPPLVLAGTVSNGLLAYFTPDSKLRWLYATAAALTFSILPWTLLYGAGRWKVQQLFEEDGYVMEEQKGIMPGSFTTEPEAGRWGEGVEMKDIAERWARMNNGRWIVTAVAMCVSALATCGRAAQGAYRP